MITAVCTCGQVWRTEESSLIRNTTCTDCGDHKTLVTAEVLEPGAGAADFDATLTVIAGPSDVGRQYFLGGVVDIQLGKSENRSAERTGRVGWQVSRLPHMLSACSRFNATSPSFSVSGRLAPVGDFRGT